MREKWSKRTLQREKTSSNGRNVTTATLTYDVLDHLVAWNAGSTNQEWYAYDASGNRVLRRSTMGSGTSITTYAFGLEEHVYGATGINTGNTYYYNLGGRLIGSLTGITTLTPQFFLTDALGSVLATFSAIAGSAAVLGNQVYGPYGNQRYTQGSMGTAKGYTGQYADETGLDYYNARYYDPVVGRFVSADTVQGNEQGMDPYAYVAGNPETMNDPTGHWIWGAAAITIGLGALAVVGIGALGIISAPLLLAVAGGVATAFVVSAVIGAKNGAFTSNDNFDNWGFGTLISEVIGGAATGLAYGLGNAVQSFAENTNISTWGKMAPTTNISAGQAATANQSGQAIGNIISGGSAAGINLSKIHAPGIGSRSKPAVHHSPAPRSTSRRVPSYKNRSYSHYTAPKSNWTSSYVNSSGWQQSVWNGWLSTTSSYDPSSWITYQGTQNTHYVRDIAAARNGGF